MKLWVVEKMEDGFVLNRTGANWVLKATQEDRFGSKPKFSISQEDVDKLSTAGKISVNGNKAKLAN